MAADTTTDEVTKPRVKDAFLAHVRCEATTTASSFGLKVRAAESSR